MCYLSEKIINISNELGGIDKFILKYSQMKEEEIYKDILYYWSNNHATLKGNKVKFSEILYNIFNPHTIIYCQNNNKKLFKSFKNGYGKYCRVIDCNYCKKEKYLSYKKSQLRPEVKEKRNQTNIEKYGATCSLQNKTVKEKAIQTNLKKYGVENTFSSDYIREKIKQTNIEKYGCENPGGNTTIKKKIKETMLEKYGVVHNTQINMNPYAYNILTSKKLLEEFTKGKTNIQVCEELSICKSTLHVWIKKHNIKHKMVSLLSSSSSLEDNIITFLSEYNIKVVKNTRKIISPKEIDIWIPSHNIGIEVHGLYWHSEGFKKENKEIHLEKYNLTKEQNIILYQFFEDEINNKLDIIKSMLLSKLNKIENTIYENDCEIRKISWKGAKEFLDNNHILGHYNTCDYNFGLYYNNELVYIMSFIKNSDDHYELYRFCNKINTSVVRGFDKLFKHFINTYDPKQITSYSDKRLCSDESYENNNFNHVGNTDIDYWVVKKAKRWHKSKFTNYKLVEKEQNTNINILEILQSIGYDRVWDCGSTKWVWEKK